MLSSARINSVSVRSSQLCEAFTTHVYYVPFARSVIFHSFSFTSGVVQCDRCSVAVGYCCFACFVLVIAFGFTRLHVYHSAVCWIAELSRLSALFIHVCVTHRMWARICVAAASKSDTMLISNSWNKIHFSCVHRLAEVASPPSRCKAMHQKEKRSCSKR